MVTQQLVEAGIANPDEYRNLLQRATTLEQEIGTLEKRRMTADERGDGVPIIFRESVNLSGRAPEYSVIDDSELHLVIWAAAEPEATPGPED